MSGDNGRTTAQHTVDTVTPEQELRARVDVLEGIVADLCEILSAAQVSEVDPLEAGHQVFVQNIRRRRRL